MLSAYSIHLKLSLNPQMTSSLTNPKLSSSLTHYYLHALSPKLSAIASATFNLADMLELLMHMFNVSFIDDTIQE